MPKRYLFTEEWYPVFSLREEWYDWSCDEDEYQMFTDEELADLVRVGKEFADWQRRIVNRFGKNLTNHEYGDHIDEPTEKQEV